MQSSKRKAPARSNLLMANVLDYGTQRIAASPNVDHWQEEMPRYDAEVLLGHIIGEDIIDSDPGDRVLTPAQRQKFLAFVRRRVAGEPTSLITRRFRFYGLELLIRPGVFTPRSSSELLVDEICKFLRRRRAPRLHVDVATGSGAIALAVGNSVSGSKAWGLDISPDAVRLGKDNAKHLGLRNVQFLQSDMLASLLPRLAGKIDSFSIHPPYVARGEIEELPAEIRDWEPYFSLTDGSDDGLDLVRRLVDDAPNWLAPHGRVFVEIGPYLARKTQGVLRRGGFSEVVSARDEVGATRVINGRL